MDVGGSTARALGDAFVSDAGAVSPVARRRRESRRSLSACAPLVEPPAHETAQYGGCRGEGRRHCCAFAVPPGTHPRPGRSELPRGLDPCESARRVRSIPSVRRAGRPIPAAFPPGRHVPVGAGMPTG